LKKIKTKFKDLIIYKKETYNDNRGYFRELYLQKHFKKSFPFDVMSFSKKNVLRGFHLQTKNPQAKLITVLKGKIYDVCIDCRKNSSTYGKYFSINLSENDNTSILIPEGFAHGFCTLTDKVILHYKCSNYRDKGSEVGILWNDSDLNITWPKNKNYIVSAKDKNNLTFEEFTRKFI
jgi:dTDP-4-dehydrorhamnose 3,5-epimerase